MRIEQGATKPGHAVGKAALRVMRGGLRPGTKPAQDTRELIAEQSLDTRVFDGRHYGDSHGFEPCDRAVCRAEQKMRARMGSNRLDERLIRLDEAGIRGGRCVGDHAARKQKLPGRQNRSGLVR